jgi:hypothetical protein
LRYLTDALVAETKGTPVIVGALRRGMVATRLLTDQYEGRPEEWIRARPILSVLTDQVDTVAPWLARRALENRKRGARFNWSNPARMAARFLLAAFRRRDPFATVQLPTGLPGSGDPA